MKTVLKTLCLVSLAAGTLQAATHAASVSTGAEAYVPRSVPVAQTATVPVYISGSSARSVLFSQTGIVVTGLAAQDFEFAYDAYDCEVADLFTVSGSWSVDGVRVCNSADTAGPTDPGATFNVRFYMADGPMGAPGTLVAQELGASYIFEGATNFIPLSAPVCLSGGDYYVSFQVSQAFDPYGQWYAGVLASLGGNQWLNAGGGFAVGPDWVTHPYGPNDLCYELEGSLDCGGASTNDLAGTFELGQAYPNPFNPSTTIHFTLAETANASLKVFNVTGAEVASLVSGLTSAGEHSVVFDAASLTSGVYYYALDVNGAVQTRKMILVK